MKIRTEKVISVQDWDELVTKTYGRPYAFQQQDGCKSRGVFRFEVPNQADDYENNTVPEVVNHPDMGVSFKAWLARDPKAPLTGEPDKPMSQWTIDLWWGRNFYPDHQMVANDLHARGLLGAGEYTILIDW